MFKMSLIFGIVFAALGVAIGAFGAHSLKPILTPDMAQTFETAVRYQMYHALALISTGLLQQRNSIKAWRAATVLFIIGIIAFSGSLYALVGLKVTGQIGLGGLGVVTPFGGVFLIAGWASLLRGVVSLKQS